MTIEGFHQHHGQVSDTGLVIRIADVDYPAIATAVFIFNDSIETLNAVGDVGKAPFLRAALNQLNRRALNQVKN